MSSRVPSLVYTVHSGLGVQLQALVNAAFLANITGHTLRVPPWLSRSDVTDNMWDPAKRVGRKCKWPFIDDRKTNLLRYSEQFLCKFLCSDAKKRKQPILSFATIYDIGQVVGAIEAKDDPLYCARCAATQQSLCPTMDLDAHLLHLDKNDPGRDHSWQATFSTTGPSLETANCSETKSKLIPSPSSCTRMLQAIERVSEMLARRNRSTVCLGPINDFFFDMPYPNAGNILARCSSTHPLAARLHDGGLPLQPRLLSLIPKLFPEPCDACVYARLPDYAISLRSLQDAILSADGLKLTKAFTKSFRKGQIRTGGVEIVSSCASSQCRDLFAEGIHSRVERLPKLAGQGWHELKSVGPQMVRRYDAGRHASAIRELLELGLPKDHAHIFYDQLRCARCRRVYGLSSKQGALRAGARNTSSFFRTIARLHHRLREQGAIGSGAQLDLLKPEQFYHPHGVPLRLR